MRKRKNHKKQQHQKRPKHHEKLPKKQGKTLTGTIQKNPRGFAFVLSKDKLGKDYFVPPHDAQFLMNGDVVEYEVGFFKNKPEAKIKKILERSQTHAFGKVVLENRKYYLRSFREEYFLIASPKNIHEHDYALGKITEYPTHDTTAIVTIEKNLGQTLSPSFDNLITIRQYNLPDVFSEALLNEAEAVALQMETKDADRVDLTHLGFVTIDGADAKDFDDAVYAEKSDDGYVLYVAIADVSYFVKENSLLDKEALKRGTSCYFPNFCLPMLPEVLSNNICSLVPKTPRKTLTAKIYFDGTGEVLRSEFFEGMIKTIKRMTYHEMENSFEDPHFKDMVTLFKLLLKKRNERGVLDFDLPECKFELDKDGMPVKIFNAERLKAHKLIEEFMITANCVVAEALKEHAIPSLYRVHEQPALEALDEMNMLLKSLAISEKLENLNPKSFSIILEKTKNMKGASTFHQAVLRLQKQAKYFFEPLGHFGLNLADYTHFTSPIRRYPDLIVHRSLKRLIQAKKSPDKRSGVNFEALGEWTSQKERRAVEAERFIVRRKQCWYMQQHLGAEFKGQISGISEKGVFVLLPEFVLDGFLPLTSMSEAYSYNENKKCMQARSGKKTLSLGDSLLIQVVRVSVDDGQIEFGEAP